MKTVFPHGLLLACLFGSLGARGQTGPDPAILGAAGEAFTANGLVLDWTIGEVAISTWQPAGVVQLLEGFHRGTWAPAEVAETATADLAVYPNPFKTEVWVRLASSDATKAVKLEIFDLQGRQLRALSAVPEQGRVHLELADLPVAGYVLSVFEPSTGKRTNHFLLKND